MDFLMGFLSVKKEKRNSEKFCKMSYSVMLCIIYNYKKTFDNVFSEDSILTNLGQNTA